MAEESGVGKNEKSPDFADRSKEIKLPTIYKEMEVSVAHSLYERFGWVVVSGTMSVYKNKKGEEKKQFAFPNGWQKTIRKDYNKSANGFALLTGKVNGIIAIDIDDPTLPHNIKLMELMEECNMIQTTKKGFHYIYKYTDKIKQTTSNELALDTRNEGGCVFCEPSNATNDNGEIVASYEWTRTPLDDEELMEVPQAVIDYLGELDMRYIGGESVNEVVEEKPKEEVLAVPAPQSNEKKLVEVANGLNIKRINNYDDWVRIGMILYNEGYSVEDWVAVSAKCKEHDRSLERSVKHWTTFNRSSRKLTGATLWKWLKEDDKNLFFSLMEKRDDFWSLVEIVNHKDIAQYFYNQNPDAYVWHETMGWFSLTKENVWKNYESKQPSNLKRHIADTMMSYAMDSKKAELVRYARESAREKEPQKLKALMETHNKRMGLYAVAYKCFGTSDFCNGVIAFLPSFFENQDLEKLMDMNTNLFAFTNGVFDCETCEFRPIKPSDYIATTTGYAYNDVKDKTIRKEVNAMLYGLFENEDDKEYLVRVLATCLFGSNRFEEYYVFTGSGGNGKGVMGDLLTKTFGNYYLSVDNTLFTKPLERKDQPIPALVEARCRRIMMTTEPESDNKLQVGLLKKVSGGDPIEARTLHDKHIWKYVAQFKLFLQTNNIPKLNRVDQGVQRRMRIIPFPFKFVPKEKMTDPKIHRLGDPDVKDRKCKSNEWRDTFIQILMETYKEIKDWKSLPPPQSVVSATGDYFDDNNPLKRWLEQYYDITKLDTDFVGARTLKEAYKTDMKVEQISDVAFKQLMSFNNLNSKHTSEGNVFLGLKRKSPFTEE